MPKTETIIENTSIISEIAAYFFTLFFINNLITFVTNVVSEKENKNKEINKIMGMYDSTFWLSWIIVYLLMFTVLNLFVSIVLIAIDFFYTVNLTIIFFILIELFALTTISFGMVFTTLFKKSKTAG
jgi:ATP-binding cassette subfamily A (ABC1) protein 5